MIFKWSITVHVYGSFKNAQCFNSERFIPKTATKSEICCNYGISDTEGVVTELLFCCFSLIIMFADCTQYIFILSVVYCVFKRIV